MRCHTDVLNAEMRQQFWKHRKVRGDSVFDADWCCCADARAVGVDDSDVMSPGDGVEGCVGEAPAEEAAEEENHGAAARRAVIGVGNAVSGVV